LAAIVELCKQKLQQTANNAVASLHAGMSQQLTTACTTEVALQGWG